MRSLLAVLAALLTAGCGDGPPRTPASPTPVVFAEHASARFVFHHTQLDAASIARTAAIVEAEYARIVGDLGVTSMPAVSVFLYPDVVSMQRAVSPAVGALPAGARGLVTAVDRIHVLSPSLSAEWSYEQGTSAIVHEFAHCVSMRVNPTIPNNPRWLWEVVAVHEAAQFVHPRDVPFLASGQPPSLSRMNGFDNSDVYGAGAVIGEFIVSRWGRDGLVALIRSNGNVAQVTGLSEAAFVSEWYAFVRARYLGGAP